MIEIWIGAQQCKIIGILLIILLFMILKMVVSEEIMDETGEMSDEIQMVENLFDDQILLRVVKVMIFKNLSKR
jgi:hypothetical protein